MKNKAKKLVVGVLSFCMMATSVPMMQVQAETQQKAAGTTYYIDQDGGNDSNSGTSEAQAWSSLEKINQTTFKPGDTILFQSGDTWTGQLSPKGSGEEGKPITIGKYGDEDKRPLIQGNNWCGENGDNLEDRIFNAAVYFYNQEYWEITSLEVTNRIPGENPDDHIKKYGILIMGQDAGELNQMNCRDLYVHDVVSHPISQQAGIARGGIIYVIRGNEKETYWNNITVENNKVGPRINHYGINFLSTWGSNRFAHETGIPDAEYAGKRANSKNLVIRNNYLQDIGNAAICPSAYANALIEYNTSDGCNSGPNGNVPIWWENGDYTVAQFNEVFNSGASDSKEDSQAFDADGNAKLNYIQYNYTHDNPSGAFFECALGTKYTTHIRYNICQNDGYGTNSHAGGAFVTIGGGSSTAGSKMYVYNNDFYLSEGHDSFITNSWDEQELIVENYQFKNNVIYSDAKSKGWHEFLMGTASHNAYGGTDTNILREDDKNAVTVTKDDFVNIGTGGKGLDSVDGYKLSENSECIDAGTLIEGNGGLDYWGNPVSSVSAPNIGADNSKVSADAGNEGIDFEDREVAESTLKGLYQGCLFYDGWMTAEKSGSKVLYSNGKKDILNITLPEGKTLKSFQASCSDSALVTISGQNESKVFNISSTNNRYETGFERALGRMTITIETAKGSQDVKFDNLVLADGSTEQKNLSLEGTAYCDDKFQYPASQANDGDEVTMWVHEGYDIDNAWWQIDLGQNYDLSNFELVFEKDEPEGAWGYQLFGARDGEKYTDPMFVATDNTDGSRVQKGELPEGSVYRWVWVSLTKMPGEDFWPGFAEFRVFERNASGVDKKQMESLIERAEGLIKEDCAEATWNTMQNALNAAKSVLNNQEATQIDIDSEYLKLESTVWPVMKENLSALYDANKDKQQGDYTNASWTLFTDALLVAKEVLTNDSVDPEKVEDALATLKETINGLEVKGDKTDLRKLYNDNQGKDASKYITASWEKFDTAIQAAKTVLDNSDAGQLEVNNALEALKQAIAQLVERGDKTELRKLYDDNQGKDESKYTAESWETFNTALQAAKTVLDNVDANQSDVDESVEALKQAILGLTEKPQEPEVDKSELSKLYEDNQGKDASKYTEDSWKKFDDALKAAKTVLDKADASQEEVDASVEALKQAIEGLKLNEGEPEVDKSELSKLYEDNQGKDASKYTEDSWKKFDDALKAAKTVLDKADASQEEVDASVEALKQAIEGLKLNEGEPEVDKSELSKLYEDNQGKDASKYTEESWKKFDDALKAAKTVLDKADASQEEVDASVEALKQAIAGLKEKPEEPKVDKTELQKLYDANLGKDANKYTEESWKNFSNAMDKAKAVLANEKATQSDVNSCIDELKQAAKALKEKEEPKDEPKDDPKGQWESNGNGWWFQKDDGTYPTNEWQKINDTWYHFDQNGYMQTGWIEDGGTWYYLNDSGSMATGWVADGDTWYYLNDSGSMATGWAMANGAWYYMNSSGAMQTGWVVENDTWYYLNDNGSMATGWIMENGTWYYLYDNGSMAFGWVMVNGAWYYFNGSGAMQTGWLSIGGVWYFLNDNGSMVTGWLHDGATWYYLNDNGSMATGWVNVGGTWYYMTSNGSMLANTTRTIDGKRYQFASSGACLNP